MKEIIKWIKNICIASITVISWMTMIDASTNNDVINLFQDNKLASSIASLLTLKSETTMIHFVLFFCLIFFINYVDRYEIKDQYVKRIIIIQSIVFAICLYIGYYFSTTDEFERYIFSIRSICFSSLFLISNSIVLYDVFKTLYTYLYINVIEQDIYIDKKKYFLCAVAFLVVTWLPTYIAFWPAFFMGDTENIIYMVYNYPTNLIEGVNLLSDEVLLTNHHPVVYTCLVGICIRLSQIMGMSVSWGISFVAIIQSIITIFTLASSLVYVISQVRRFAKQWYIFSLLFLGLCPWFPKYAIMITKDTLFADFLMLFSIQIYRMNTSENEMKEYIKCIVLSLFVILMRKNGIYIVVGTIVLSCLLQWKAKKKWILALIIVLLFNIGYSKVILPANKITEGSIAEALSIPFQQTARYVSLYSDEVTKEEAEKIDAILDYEHLHELYNGNISDPVKATYNKDATRAELVEYFEVWFRMFLKHPMTYVASFCQNYYGYTYPVVNDELNLYRANAGSIDNTNRDYGFCFANIDRTMSKNLRAIIKTYDLLWLSLPPLDLFMTSGLYGLLTIFCIFGSVMYRRKEKFAYMCTYGLLLISILFGPCNAIGYERYIYPCIVALPFMFVLTFESKTVVND